MGGLCLGLAGIILALLWLFPGYPSYWAEWNPPFASSEGRKLCRFARIADLGIIITVILAHLERYPIGAAAQPRLRGWRISPSIGPLDRVLKFCELGQRADLSGFYLGRSCAALAYLLDGPRSPSQQGAGEEAVARSLIAGKIAILISIPVVVAI